MHEIWAHERTGVQTTGAGSAITIWIGNYYILVHIYNSSVPSSGPAHSKHTALSLWVAHVASWV